MSEDTQTVELQIEKVVYRGKGLARLDGRVVFVEGALPGETVTVRVDRWHKRHADARLIEVQQASPSRIEPACPLALRPEAEQATALPCPGCSYQHVAYTAELEMKQRQFMNFLDQRAHLDTHCCAPPVAAPSPLGYRNKIMLHAFTGRKGLCLGYYAADNETILDIPHCPLAAPAINHELSELRSAQAFTSALRPRETVTLRYTDNDGVMHWKAKTSGGRLRVPATDRCLTESTTLGTLQVPLGSFFQVNPAVADLLGNAVRAILQDLRPKVVIDLYCGTGFLTLAAAQAGVPHIHGVERDTAAVRSAHKNLREHPGTNFFIGSAATGLQRLVSRIAGESTALVLDPPRRGLEPVLIDTIRRISPHAILYVSCAPDTLVRDLLALTPLGYSLSHCRVYDMFPRTAHFESLSVLTRQSPA